MDLYLATINTPGYLPQDDDLHVFTDPRDAWRYLCEERDRALNDLDDMGPDYDMTMAAMETTPGTWRDTPGTVYGPTPGYGGDHDRGVAYTVSLWAHAGYPHEHGHLYDCGPCEYTCHCDPDPDSSAETCVHCDLVSTGEHECESDAGCALHG